MEGECGWHTAARCARPARPASPKNRARRRQKIAARERTCDARDERAAVARHPACALEALWVGLAAFGEGGGVCGAEGGRALDLCQAGGRLRAGGGSSGLRLLWYWQYLQCFSALPFALS